jgi:hypothetical protein
MKSTRTNLISVDEDEERKESNISARHLLESEREALSAQATITTLGRIFGQG